MAIRWRGRFAPWGGVMGWRNCRASLSLLDEVNRRWPNRSKVSDGTVGDASHATRSSDHNPWFVLAGQGIVRARDITAKGIDAPALCEHLRRLGAAGDNRLTDGGYLIFNRCITKPDFSGWKTYTGSNPHTSHMHVSFSQLPAGFDAVRPWGITGSAPSTAAPAKGFLMALTDAQQQEMYAAMLEAREAARSVLFGRAGVRPAGEMALAVAGIGSTVAAMRTELGALATRPAANVDTSAIVAGVVDAIVRQGLAGPVADELARRLAPK